MDKIIIDVEDKEELLDALNNSIIALAEVRTKFFFGGIELSEKWNKWLTNNHNNSCIECYELLNKRVKLLQNIFKQIEDSSDEKAYIKNGCCSKCGTLLKFESCDIYGSTIIYPSYCHICGKKLNGFKPPKKEDNSNKEGDRE